MQLQTKALYNLIRFNLDQGEKVQCEPWQSQDLSSLSEEELFKIINDLGFSQSEEQFVTFASDADSPEALSEFLVEEKGDISLYDRLYLVIFELWKRFFPDRKTISIFCDELDQLINLYDNHLLESDESIQDALESLKEILEENVDEGQNPKESWKLIIQYCAHDLSSFLYDYISELIDTGHELYAQELIEAFYPFVGDRWFDFLRIRISDYVDADEEIRVLVSTFTKKPNFDLQVEVLDYLVETSDPDLFLSLLKKTISQIEDREGFEDLVEIAIDFFNNSDQPQKAEELEKMHDSYDSLPSDKKAFLSIIS